MKKMIILSAFSILAGILPVSAQDSSTTTTTYNTLGLLMGVISTIALVLVIMLMYRDRRKTISGIQDQSKSNPEPVTTQSINNPGSGV